MTNHPYVTSISGIAQGQFVRTTSITLSLSDGSKMTFESDPESSEIEKITIRDFTFIPHSESSDKVKKLCHELSKMAKSGTQSWCECYLAENGVEFGRLVNDVYQHLSESIPVESESTATGTIAMALHIQHTTEVIRHRLHLSSMVSGNNETVMSLFDAWTANATADRYGRVCYHHWNIPDCYILVESMVDHRKGGTYFVLRLYKNEIELGGGIPELLFHRLATSQFLL